jgi:hypothetical protein
LVGPRAEVRDNGAIGRKKALGVARGLKPLRPSFPLAGGLVGVLRTVIEIALLAMFDTWEKFPFRRAIAFELVCDDRPRDIPQPFEQLAEKLLRCSLIAPALHAAAPRYRARSQSDLPTARDSTVPH